MNRPPTWIGALLFAIGLLVGTACTPPRAEMCDGGSQGCSCTSGGACNPGLACEANVCVAPGSATGGPIESSDASDSGGAEESADATAQGTDATTQSTASEESDDSGASSGGPDDAATCDESLCTEAYCDNLREYCVWFLGDPANVSGDADTCDECVTIFIEGKAELPLVWCAEVFQCWVNCIASEGETNYAQVHDCNDIFCDGVNVDGTGLCE